MIYSTEKWLLLIHNIPPKPGYFRVKIWRRLHKLGAIAIKSSVYALPRSESSQEAFQWVLREVVQGGGDASICEASFVEGLSNDEIVRMFTEARNSDYSELIEEARGIRKKKLSRKGSAKTEDWATDLSRLQQRLSEITEVDFFGAPRREAAEAAVEEIRKLRQGPAAASQAGKKQIRLEELQDRTWVTRKGIHVDRIASAWLIRRFIDKNAKFRFVEGKGFKGDSASLRFDMFDAEFTHEGDLCTFEVLLGRTGLKDRALGSIAEIIHNIDLKDGKYARDDVSGVETVLNGICVSHSKDEARLARGSELFDDLYGYFRQKGKSG